MKGIFSFSILAFGFCLQNASAEALCNGYPASGDPAKCYAYCVDHGNCNNPIDPKCAGTYRDCCSCCCADNQCGDICKL